MSNKEIRSWTGEAVKGNIGFLLAVSLLCTLPALIGVLVGYLSYDRLPFLWVWASGLLTAFLNLGSICVVLKLIQEEKQDLTALAVPFQAPWVGKTLAVIFLLSVLKVIGIRLFHLGPLALFHAGLMVLSSILLEFFISTVLLPIPYMLFFFPDWPVGQVISEGFRAGYENFWDIVGFQFSLILPILGIVLFMVLSCVFVSVLTIFVMIFGVIGLVLYPSYIMLAQGKYAIERFSK